MTEVSCSLESKCEMSLRGSGAFRTHGIVHANYREITSGGIVKEHASIVRSSAIPLAISAKQTATLAPASPSLSPSLTPSPMRACGVLRIRLWRVEQIEHYSLPLSLRSPSSQPRLIHCAGNIGGGDFRAPEVVSIFCYLAKVDVL